MRIFLSGPMGSGKSTVAKALASLLRLPMHDLDGRVEARAETSIRELFAARGEGEFRKLEHEELRRVIAEDNASVTALGGGTVVDEQCRTMALDAGLVVTLMAPVDVLASRVAREEGRPLLAGKDAKDVLATLLQRRAFAYAESHGTVDASRPVDEVAAAIRDIVERRPLLVPLGERSYRVDIGAGVRRRVPEILEDLNATSVLAVTDEHVAQPWRSAIEESVHGFRHELVVLPPGEAHKHIASIQTLWDRGLGGGIDRNGVVLAVGGGVVGDMAGFTAATLLRGIRLVQVPTTLLAMVDASVGGKTGFDHAAGKNLIGAFHQPSAVVVDPELLGTLPHREYRAGIAEVIKGAWLEGEEAVAALEASMAELVAREPRALEATVRRAIAHKARVVAADEREGGMRALLNLGHTVGHAIERAGAFDRYLHGEAVALGLVAAFRVGRALGRDADEARLLALLQRAGLPVDLDEVLHGPLSSVAFESLRSDKKRRGDHIVFVVPGAPGHTELVPLGVDAIRTYVWPG
ncbi:MAG: 3-dehydroquinate synthase [Myxococcota bacterium]